LNLAAEINTPKLIVSAVEAGLGFAVTAYCACHAKLAQKEVSASPIQGLRVSWSIIHSRESPLPLSGRLIEDLFISIAKERINSGLWLNARLLAAPTRNRPSRPSKS